MSDDGRGPGSPPPPDSAGDVPGISRPRAAAGDWGGFSPNGQAPAQPGDRSARLRALVRAAGLRSKLARLNLEGLLVLAEERLGALDDALAGRSQALALGLSPDLDAVVHGVTVRLAETLSQVEKAAETLDLTSLHALVADLGCSALAASKGRN